MGRVAIIKKRMGPGLKALVLGGAFVLSLGIGPGSFQAAALGGVASSPSENGAPRVGRTSEGKYDLDFKSASLINVLNVLSGLSGMNFVAGREVAERQVNMTLANAGLDDVLQSLAYGCNVTYDFIPGKNIYVFRGASDAPEDPALLTRVFKLYYARVAKIRERDFAAGTSTGDGQASVPSQEIAPGAVADDAEGQEAAIGKAIAGILSPRGKVSAEDRSNSLIVTDFEDRLKMIESTIAQLDRPLDQVLIDLLLIETSEDLDRDLGLAWGDAEGFGGAVGGDQAGPVRQASLGARDLSGLLEKVRTLEKASKLKVLAKPRVLVLDNHPALVKIATDAAIGEVISLSGGQGSGHGFAERAEIGTVLKVTPLINASNRITLNVEPSFATVGPSALQSAGGPTMDPTVRMTLTTMMLNDGQTIALGGMLWGDRGGRSDRELILFMTPHIVTDPSRLTPPESSAVGGGGPR